MKPRKPPPPTTLAPKPPVDLSSVIAQLDSLQFNDTQLAARVRLLEKMIDTRATVWYKRLWFRIDGWPPWYEVATERKHRWWHKHV